MAKRKHKKNIWLNLIKKRFLRRKGISNPIFRQVVKGKIDFIKAVRGSENSAYIKFREQLRALAPEMIKEPSSEPKSDKYLGKGNRFALLIGVDEYDDNNYSTLISCSKDVSLLERRLIYNKFKPENTKAFTNYHEDLMPTKNKIMALLTEMCNKVESDDLFFFYFSGHGDLFDDNTYLVTKDTYSTTVQDSALDLEKIVSTINNCKARAKVLVIDACHAGGKASSKAGLTVMSGKFINLTFLKARGLVILTSCERDQLSYIMGDISQSVFSYYFLEALEGRADYAKKGFVTVTDVHEFVSAQVPRWCEQRSWKQNPIMTTSMTGNIILSYY